MTSHPTLDRAVRVIDQHIHLWETLPKPLTSAQIAVLAELHSIQNTLQQVSITP